MSDFDNERPCTCQHGEARHWFYRESCLDCDCGRYFDRILELSY